MCSSDLGRLDGSFSIMVTPKPGHAPDEMARIVDEEVRTLIREGVTDRELARARNTFLAGFLDNLSSIVNKADQLNYYNYYAGTPDFVQKDAARYEGVTNADVQRVAASVLARPRVVLTVVPEGKKELMVRGVVQ